VGVVAVTALAGCAADQPTPRSNPSWETKTRVALTDLVNAAGPYPIFASPATPPNLEATADATRALALSRRSVPRGLQALAIRSWDRKHGLYRAARREDAVLVTGNVVRALLVVPSGPRLVRQHVDEILAALERRRRRGGFAPMATGRATATATLGAYRILAALEQLTGVSNAQRIRLHRLATGIAQPRGCRLRDVARSVSTVLSASVRLERCELAGERIRLDASARRGATAGARAALQQLRRASTLGPQEIAIARAVDLLARHDVELREAAQAARAVVRGALAGVGGRRLAPEAGVTGIEVAVEVASADGGHVDLHPEVRGRLVRAVRWEGTLPDIVVSADPIETVLGAQALAMLGRPAERASARPPGPLAGRLVLALGLGPTRWLKEDSHAAVLRLRSGSPLPEAALAAMAIKRSDGCDAAARIALRAYVRRLAVQGSQLRSRADTGALFWVALLLDGADGCLPPNADVTALRNAAEGRLRSLRQADGAAGALPHTEPDIRSTWLAAEAGCLLRMGAGVTPRGWSRSRSSSRPALTPFGSGFSVVDAYAALRSRALAEGGCSSGWWAAG
jgi:hypothetical protein